MNYVSAAGLKFLEAFSLINLPISFDKDQEQHTRDFMHRNNIHIRPHQKHRMCQNLRFKNINKANQSRTSPLKPTGPPQIEETDKKEKNTDLFQKPVYETESSCCPTEN